MNDYNFKFAFVILHYRNIDDTVECVESILKNVGGTNRQIIIVDNGSSNGSDKLLKERYQDNQLIHLIFSDKNLGFAKGNNLGFDYAKKKLKADFIILINNDTLIEQKEFLSKIAEEYEFSKFHILGPDIISIKDRSHQNPRRLTIQNPDELKKTIKLYSALLFLNYFVLDKLLERWKKKIIKTPLVKAGDSYTPSWKERLEGVKLHGSALIFSPLFVEKYDGLYPKTFMYSEEAILYFISKRDKLKTVYSPEVKIFHKEDASTDNMFNKNYKKRRFYYKNFIKSGKIFLKLMENSK